MRCDEHSDRLAITGRINEQSDVMHECRCRALRMRERVCLFARMLLGRRWGDSGE